MIHKNNNKLGLLITYHRKHEEESNDYVIRIVENCFSIKVVIIKNSLNYNSKSNENRLKVKCTCRSIIYIQEYDL